MFLLGALALLLCTLAFPLGALLLLLALLLARRDHFAVAVAPAQPGGDAILVFAVPQSQPDFHQGKPTPVHNLVFPLLHGEDAENASAQLIVGIENNVIGNAHA